MYNIFSLLWEIETGAVYRMTKAHDIYSGLGAEAALRPLGDGGRGDVKEGGEEDVPRVQELHPKKEDKGEDATGGNVTSSASPLPSTPTSVGGGERGESVAGVKGGDVEEDDDEEEELARAIQRAESIVRSLADVKVFALSGTPGSVLEARGEVGKGQPCARFAGLFDAVFVSARATQIADCDWFAGLLKPRALVSLESAKFVVPLNKEQKAEFTSKVREFSAARGWAAIVPPVARRHRDELDLEDDVLFFRNETPMK
jgi:hypothetical protein